jgi:hypothetical protein
MMAERPGGAVELDLSCPSVSVFLLSSSLLLLSSTSTYLADNPQNYYIHLLKIFYYYILWPALNLKRGGG